MEKAFNYVTVKDIYIAIAVSFLLVQRLGLVACPVKRLIEDELALFGSGAEPSPAQDAGRSFSFSPRYSPNTVATVNTLRDTSTSPNSSCMF